LRERLQPRVLDPALKNRISHRGLALAVLREKLPSL
jgi:inosine/xanthosine triphosphate pyrophosphatase family protein